MKFKYFIGKNRTYGPQDLKTDKHIFKTSEKNPPIGVGGDFEGPYKSLKELIERSTFYRDIKKANSRTASKLILPKNIRELENFLLIPKGKTFEKEFIVSFQHALKAEFKNGQVQGLHHYNPKDTEIVKIYQTNSKGVVDADVLKQDFFTKVWHHKRTTLFPLHWHIGNILAELEIAYLYRFLISGTKNKYGGITVNGIKVIFVFVNGKGKTVYPIV